MAINIKPSHKGMLHKALRIPEGQPIPLSRLTRLKKSTSPHMRKMATFAVNAKKFKH